MADKPKTGIDNSKSGAPDARHFDRNTWLSLSAWKGGIAGKILIVFAASFGVWHILTNIYLVEPGLWQNAIHFAGFAFLASVMFSPFGRYASSRYAIILDIIYGLLVAAAALWVAGAETGIYERTLAVTGQPWQFTLVDWAAGFLLLFAALDLSRRVSGWVIPILIISSMSYILFLGSYLPGVFRAASLPLNDVLFRTLYNDEGMFGILASIFHQHNPVYDFRRFSRCFGGERFRH